MQVPGALFSGGDTHFSQGDGEIFCGAIEMGGFIDFHVDLIKGGMETYGVTTNPILTPGNVEPRYSEFVTLIGIGVDHTSDTQLCNDATVAYRNACLNVVDYLVKFGYSGPHAYLLLGARRSRIGSAGRSTSRTPAARSTCPRRSSTSTSDRRLRVRSPGTGEATLCRPDLRSSTSRRVHRRSSAAAPVRQ